MTPTPNALGEPPNEEIDFSSGQQQPRELGNNPAGGFNVQQYSADGTWMVYSRRDEEMNSEIYLYDIRAKKEYNVTQSPNNETSAALTPDGKTVVFTSDRDGAVNQLFAVSLAKLTEDPNDPLVRERIRRASAPAGGRGGGAGAGQEVHRLVLASPRDERISFSLTLRIDRRAEWKQMFEETWRVMKYRYYNPAMNGYDWAAIKVKYEPLLPYVRHLGGRIDLTPPFAGHLNRKSSLKL